MNKDLWRKFKKRLAGRFLPKLIYFLIRGIHRTLRIRVVGGEAVQSLHDRQEGIVMVSWHGRLFIGPFAYRGKGAHCLISIHGDGEIVAGVVRCFGIEVVRGSSSRGGDRALRQLVQLARENRDLGITPDGPRGPAESVKPGVAVLARMAGRPVVPLSFSCSSAKRFASWDRFLLPYPFSRAVIVWGAPLYYREGEDLEVFRQRIEQGLRETTAQADGYFSS